MAWADLTRSNTTLGRNHSRFLNIDPFTSADGSVDFYLSLREADASGRGVSFMLSETDPVLLEDDPNAVI